jgi:hypothetical protein
VYKICTLEMKARNFGLLSLCTQNVAEMYFMPNLPMGDFKVGVGTHV